jgi:phosphohistidine phosphatase
MKKRIVLVRHANAEEPGFYGKDFDRKLIEKGLSESELMGDWLAGSSYLPEFIATSKAPRAAQTADIINKSLNLVSISYHQKLYDGGPLAYLNIVNQMDEKYATAMVVGHNPDISYFVDYLCGQNVGSMKKAGIAVIEFDDLAWNEISRGVGSLKLYTTPKMVRSEK